MSKGVLALLWLGLGVQRMVELWLAKRNAEWMKSQGGYEVGRGHYPLIIFVHLLFFVGIAVESFWLDKKPPDWWPIPLMLLVLVQILRIWCIRSLGRYWNTRVWIVPGHQPRDSGPYRYLRHPNYLIVIAEFLLVPAIYGATLTLGIVSFLNGLILLAIRIPVEERALREKGDYWPVMGRKGKLFPVWKKSKNT